MFLPTLDLTPTPVDELHAATALYTSAHVVDTLLNRLNWPQEPGSLLDPSAGDGSFILNALQRLDLVHHPELINRIQGWEIHPGAATEARNKITIYLQDQGFNLHHSELAAEQIIVNKDFLTDGPAAGQFRFIAGNPPYLRFQRLPQLFKDIYTAQLPSFARSDILHSFLYACTKLLAPNGTIGLICSDRFLFNQSSSRLRKTIGESLGIAHLKRLDPSTSFYRPKNRIRNSPPRIHPVEILLTPLSTGSFPLDGSAISPDDMRRTQPTGPTLKDIAKVSIAPWLGPLGIFVVNQSLATRLAQQDATLVPAVDTDDIDPASDNLRSPTRFAIRTSRTEPPVPAVDKHLRKQRERMPKRGLNRPYWIPPETINLPLDQPSLLVPRIARRLRAIPLPPGILPINHNISVINCPGTSLEQVRQLLISEPSQEWIRNNAPRLEGSYLSITTTLLRQLPVKLPLLLLQPRHP